MNWRKAVINGILYFQKNPILDELKLLQSIEYKSPEYIKSLQEKRLKDLLIHAWTNTNYYHQVLEDCGVVRNGNVDLSNFNKIPALTKAIIKKEEKNLRAKNLPRNRKIFENSSGGSTGTPLKFYQDNCYWNLNIASKIYHFKMLGKDLGEREMKIWGSLDDFLKGTEGLKVKFQNFLYNRKFVQCYKLNDEIIKQIINEINRYKPKLIWTFIDQMHIISRYILKNNIKMHKPVAIFAGATKVYSYVRKDIEKAFGVPVIDFYGSRELGDVACECSERNGFHISSLLNYVEVADNSSKLIYDKEGDFLITSLMNYAMPFIRYKIGDRGVITKRTCKCGRGFPLIDSISGRMMEMFVKPNGEILHPLLFINIIKTAFEMNEVRKFQIIQESYKKILIKLVSENGLDLSSIEPGIHSVSDKIKRIMGNDCTILFQKVDHIPLTKHGKHLYTICNLKTNLN